MRIKYSEKVKGNNQNYNWAVRFDSDGGYLGISQYNEDGSHKERVLLSPLQVKALQEFLQANTARTRLPVGGGKLPAKKSNRKGSAPAKSG